MSTLAFSAQPATARRMGPLAAIVGAHALLFWLIASGMLSQAVRVVVPQEVVLTFVTPPAPPKRTAPAPRQVELTQPAPPTPPPLPAIALPQEAAPSIAAAPVAVAVSTPAAPPVQTAPAAPPAPRLISAVEYVQAPRIDYPAMSRRMGEQGKVVLRVLVNGKGLPEQVAVQASSGFSRLDEAGKQAVQRALFKPYMEDGRAVPVFVLVPLTFQLS
ncbi:MAG TPA: energy transducer TonB [Telluria sp.]|nr:energy transducer TonB [Telluria sp.]